MSLHWKPAGSQSVTAYLIARDAQAALDFYRNVFGATVPVCMKSPEGRINHAEFHIGDSMLMICDENAELGILSPSTVGWNSVSFSMYVPDCDAVFSAAEEAGATVLKPVADQFYGDRSGVLVDPFGHTWNIATHIEDVSPEEMKRRIAEFESQADNKSSE